MASQATLNLIDLLIAAVDPNGYVDMSAIREARAAVEPCACEREVVELVAEPEVDPFVEGHKVEVEATPAAAELAAEVGVPIEQIEGTGKDGKVVKADVEAAVAE
jgi:pyruvate/2-oxoglutarate dehydrogenase complex dihydrolipoamide acyltransferase (E2) component